MKYKVGFTGTSNTKQHIDSLRYDTLIALMDALDLLHDDIELHHGDCIGADAMVHDIALKQFPHWRIRLHPPEDPKSRAFCHLREGKDDTYAERPYLLRNGDIVQAADILIAMPRRIHEEELRSGTWATVRRARKKGIEVRFA